MHMLLSAANEGRLLISLVHNSNYKSSKCQKPALHCTTAQESRYINAQFLNIMLPWWMSASWPVRCLSASRCFHYSASWSSAMRSDQTLEWGSCWRGPEAFHPRRCSSSRDQSSQTSTPRHNPSTPNQSKLKIKSLDISHWDWVANIFFTTLQANIKGTWTSLYPHLLSPINWLIIDWLINWLLIDWLIHLGVLFRRYRWKESNRGHGDMETKTNFSEHSQFTLFEDIFYDGKSRQYTTIHAPQRLTSLKHAYAVQ